MTVVERPCPYAQRVVKLDVEVTPDTKTLHMAWIKFVGCLEMQRKGCGCHEKEGCLLGEEAYTVLEKEIEA